MNPTMEAMRGAQVDPQLRARHDAAIRLLRHGAVSDGELLLSYVVWPTGAVERAIARSGVGRATPGPAQRRRAEATV